MNDVIAIIIGSILGFCYAKSGRKDHVNIVKRTKEIAKDKTEFIADPTKQSLENLKDPELLDFYETIEKPSNDED